MPLDVDGFLGQGSLGTVWKLYQYPHPRKYVAVKIIYIKDAKQIGKLSDALLVLLSAKHPHLLSVQKYFFRGTSAVGMVFDLCEMNLKTFTQSSPGWFTSKSPERRSLFLA